MKKLLYFLRLWDGIWSIPLAVLVFLFAEHIGHLLFGAGFAAYDPATFQAAIMAGAIVVFTNFIVQAALYFNFPELWCIYRNQPDSCDHDVKPYSSLTNYQKLCATIFLYCFFSVEFILVFLKLA